AIGNGNASVPADVVKIFPAALIHETRGHRSAVIESPQLAQAKHRAVVNVKDVRRVIGFDVDERGRCSPFGIAWSEIDTQDVVAHFVGYWHTGMVAIHLDR